MNLKSQNLYIEKHLMGIKGNGKLNNLYWGSWMYEAANKPEVYKLVQRYTRRPAEELYHSLKDEYELTNLAAKAEFEKVKKSLKNELLQWLEAMGDPGAKLDSSSAYKAAKGGKHFPKKENKR